MALGQLLLSQQLRRGDLLLPASQSLLAADGLI